MAARRWPGVTWVEVLVVVAVVGVIAMIVWSVVASRRVRSHGGHVRSCLTNQRQIALATAMYQSENDSLLPPAKGWPDQLKLDSDSLVCPRGAKGNNGYVYSAYAAGRKGDDLEQVRELTTVPLTADGMNTARPQVWDSNGVVDFSRHDGKAGVAFMDGHVEFLPAGEMPALEGKAKGKG